MIGERPTGAELVDALRAAAAKAGVPLKQFIAPLVTSNATSYLSNLGRAARPMALTLERVRALIAGEPIPDPRPSGFKGCIGRHDRQHAGEISISAASVAARRDLAERAHAERLPGETLAAAVKRLAHQQSTIADLRGEA